MQLRLIQSNAVVVTTHFNPSIVRDIWLVDNEIVARDEFRPGCVYTDPLVHLRTKFFNLLVTPDQIQFNPVGEREEHEQIAVNKLGAIIRTLPHTPYRGVGLNFVWHVIPEEEEAIEEFSRNLFFIPDHPLYRDFDVSDARFGSYLSKDFRDCRLKLDIKPILAEEENRIEDRLQLAFNFHRDLKDHRTAANDAITMLGRWNELFTVASEMAGSLIENREIA